ncbi:MAG: VWA domain-containing protein [Planctomycetes bacterium]|nr:VWA domain-containing protein [Planctomycetota bacterium]
MSLIHPLIAWGALAGLIPIIIHILSRRRYRPVRWAAMDFLLAALSEQSRNLRLQDLILLALRVAVLVIAAMTLARPLLSPAALDRTGLAPGTRDAVIILDTSYSMQTNRAGRTRLELAREKARQLLGALPESTRLGVVYLDDRARRATESLTADRVRISTAIDQAPLSARGSDLAPALAEALDFLRGSTAGVKRVYLISDCQAGLFERSADRIRETLAETDPSVGFVVMPVDSQPVSNLAVTDLQVESRWLRVDSPVELTARIHAFGPSPPAETHVDLWIDNRRVDRRRVALSEGRQTVTFRHSFTAPGLLNLEARLAPDAVEIDNHAHAALWIPSTIDLAVIAPDAAREQLASAYTYLHAALHHSDQDSQPAVGLPIAVRTRIAPGRAAEQLDDDLDILVLADPGALPAGAFERIDELARNGTSILITAGPDATATLGPFRSGQPGPGQWLAGLHITPPADPDGDAVFHFDPTRSQAGVLDLDSPGIRDALAGVNVFRAVTIAPPQNGDWDSALALTDGRDALLIRQLPEAPGRLALLATVLDTRWTDLPYRPALIPMLQDLSTWLVQPRLVAVRLTPGQTWRPPLAPALARNASIRLPDNTLLDAEIFGNGASARNKSSITFDRTDQPGIYRLSGPGESDAIQAAAVSVDISESDQAIWPPDRITNLLPASRCQVIPADASAETAAQAGRAGVEIWPLAAALLAGLLVAETLLAHRFSYRKRPREAAVPVGPHRLAGGTTE